MCLGHRLNFSNVLSAFVTFIQPLFNFLRVGGHFDSLSNRDTVEKDIAPCKRLWMSLVEYPCSESLRALAFISFEITFEIGFLQCGQIILIPIAF